MLQVHNSEYTRLNSDFTPHDTTSLLHLVDATETFLLRRKSALGRERRFDLAITSTLLHPTTMLRSTRDGTGRSCGPLASSSCLICQYRGSAWGPELKRGITAPHDFAGLQRVRQLHDHGCIRNVPRMVWPVDNTYNAVRRRAVVVPVRSPLSRITPDPLYTIESTHSKACGLHSSSRRCWPPLPPRALSTSNLRFPKWTNMSTPCSGNSARTWYTSSSEIRPDQLQLDSLSWPVAHLLAPSLAQADETCAAEAYQSVCLLAR